jgi:RNA polymerase sigma-54 factor
MDFFRFGEGNLKPLKMNQIAEEVGVHEATVSRIANGKYLICKWGIFELRYFFTNAATEENDSKESIKHKIKLILENHEKENAASGKTKKLSDEKIATILKEQGINIARRTVAKYRSELDIKSSFDR